MPTQLGPCRQYGRPGRMVGRRAFPHVHPPNICCPGLYSCAQTHTPLWILAAAGGCVALGVLLLGSRVIQTIGRVRRYVIPCFRFIPVYVVPNDLLPTQDLTDIDYLRGWCVEFASTLAVLIATVLGLPVSTTHCQIGAVAAVRYCMCALVLRGGQRASTRWAWRALGPAKCRGG